MRIFCKKLTAYLNAKASAHFTRMLESFQLPQPDGIAITGRTWYLTRAFSSTASVSVSVPTQNAGDVARTSISITTVEIDMGATAGQLYQPI